MLIRIKGLFNSFKKENTTIAILFKNNIVVDVAKGADPSCLHKSKYFPQLISDLENVTPDFSIGYQKLNLREKDLNSLLGLSISHFSSSLIL